MTEFIHRFVIPAAYALLPKSWNSVESTANLLAIGLIESGFEQRRQIHGPARGLWQFEAGPSSATANVLLHPTTRTIIAGVLRAMRYDPTTDPEVIQPVLEDNDILAACFARCQLRTSPRPLPGPGEAQAGWNLYESTWHPGKPRRSAWDAYYAQAWELTIGRPTPPEARA